ncbi:MAG: chemotaxis signal transduction protein CheV [Halomonadaceae bacterium]|nr:MAG: chemotaxis signal transduction protein CheV [Halomonadaceae bacterium]
MSGVMDNVNQRTQLVGQNRLELLLFRLQGRQLYGINVFKVREVLPCPRLVGIPHRHPVVRGVAHVRGETVAILDLGLAIGKKPISDEGLKEGLVIISEYNRKIQGFLVAGVDRIVNLNWDAVKPPPRQTGTDVYLTAVTEIDGQLVGIIDVEKILAEVAPMNETLSGSQAQKDFHKKSAALRILVVDDSSVARKQAQRCMEAIGFEVIVKDDGKQALDYLESLTADGSDINEHLAMMISDVEMPVMDGYTLVARCKENPLLTGLYIMLHSSLSGVFNHAMVKKVGADDFMAKFSPDELAERVMEVIDSRTH